MSAPMCSLSSQENSVLPASCKQKEQFKFNRWPLGGCPDLCGFRDKIHELYWSLGGRLATEVGSKSVLTQMETIIDTRICAGAGTAVLKET